MSDKKERQEGYYWVLYADQWRIGEYHCGRWYVIALNLVMDDSDFAEIDERRVERVSEDETKQAWAEMWEFAKSEISWVDGTIDYEDFIENGSKLFELKRKTP